MKTVVHADQRPLGILAALPEEIAELQQMLRTGALSVDTHRQNADSDGLAHQRWGQRDFLRGTLYGQDCVLALSRIGKVAAAATATTLIHRFNVGAILFTGVAGGVATGVRVGDIVIADELIQHDMDASPLFARYEIPLLARQRFSASRPMTLA